MYQFVPVFILSLTVLLFEVLVSRIFSIVYEYNILFIIISASIALLGLGGIIARLLIGRYGYKKESDDLHSPLPAFFFFLYPVSITFSCVSILTFFPELSPLGMVLIGGMPFVFAGILMGAMYWSFGENSRKVFFLDTLGGAAGCILSLPLVYMFGVINTALFTAFIASLLPFLFKFPAKKGRVLLPAAVVFTTMFLLFNVAGNSLELGKDKLVYTDNALGWMLRHLKNSVEYMGHSWDIYSRCDLVKDDSSDLKRTIFINGGTEAVMLKNEPYKKIRERYRHDITFIPYLFGKNDDILVLGAGGGRDVLLALAGGGKSITAVEINQGVFNMVNENSHYTGNIFNRAGVKGVREDGRTFIMKDKKKYDKILLSLSSTYAFADLSSIGQMENYLYTQEAFDLFFEHLKDDGSIVIFINFKELMNKFVVASLDYFQRVYGISPGKAMKHIVAFGDEDSYVAGYSFALMVKKSPFDFDSINEIIDEVRDGEMEPLLIPYTFFGDFKNLSSDTVTLEDFVEKNEKNIAPSTDDSPYFMEVIINYREKLITLCYYLLGSIVLLTLFHFPYFMFRKEKNYSAGKYFLFLPYFILSGIGFMLVEIALTKQFSFYLDYPQLNMVVVLLTILLGCGTGSIASTKLGRFGKPHSAGIILFVMLLCIQPVIGHFLYVTISLPLVLRCFLVFIFLFPISFFIGIPFPVGIAMLNTNMKKEIPWFWGINGVAAILGSVLSVVLSMAMGFKAVFISAALAYLLLGFFGYLLRGDCNT